MQGPLWRFIAKFFSIRYTFPLAFMEILHITDYRLVELLKQGAVGVLPTDTVYGLVCDASNPDAVAKLYRLKSREQKPGTTIAANAEQVIALGISEDAVRHVERFWPGVSVELPWGDCGEYLHQGTVRSAFRIVAQPDVEALLEKTGPLLTSSANLPGQPPANTVYEARAYFGDTIDFYVDGGDLSGRQPSTLVSFKDGKVEVVRQGSVQVDEQGRLPDIS